MRTFTSAVLCLAILAFSGDALAQCQPLWQLENMRVTSGECSTTPGWATCKAGVPMTFMVDAKFATANCPPDLTWDFGDGSEPVRTTTITGVTHTFDAGSRSVHVWATAQPSVQAFHHVETYWGRFRADAAPKSVDEGEGPVHITVSRDDSSRPATIDYHYDATPYGQFTRGTLVFETGQAAKTVDIPIPDDDFYYADSRLINFNLGGVTGGYGYANGGASFVVHDDDTPTEYKFAQRGMRVSEDAGSVSFDIIRSGDLSDATGAEVSGLLGTHFVGFAAGETRKTLTVPLADDDSWSGNRRGIIRCTSQLSPGLWDEIEIEITEDEPSPSFSPRTAEVQESDSTQTVSIPVTVSPRLGGGGFFHVTATRGTAGTADFSFPDDNIHWPPESATILIPVTILGDDLAESDETFDLEIDGPFRHTVTVRIVDDDRPPFSFAFDSPGYEDDEQNAAVKVVRTGLATDAARVTLVFRPHTTVVWPEPIAVDFAAGETSKTVPLGTGDGFYTGTRTATLELDWGGFTGDATVVTLSDDEEMPSLSISDASVLEGPAGAIAKAEVEVTLSAPVGSALAVGLATTPGTADASDYVAAQPPAILAPGVLSVRVPVSVRGDAEQEPDEMFTVSVASCCEGLAKVERSTATVLIRNDDGGDSSAYRIESAAMYRESEEWLIAAVTRTDSSTFASATVKLTADAARQFPPVTLRFQPGQSRREVRFFLDDPYHSGDAAATLEVFSGDRRDDRRELTIREDEDRPVIVMADATSHVETQEWTTATFHITIDPPSLHPLEVNVTSVRGHDISPNELEAIDRDLVIPPFTTAVEVPVGTRIYYPSDNRRTFQMKLTLLSLNKAVMATPTASGAVARKVPGADATLGNYDPLVSIGTARRLSVTLPLMAVAADPIDVTSSAPQALAVPANVTTTPGSREIAFDASGLSDGSATVRIKLPDSLGGQLFKAELQVSTIPTPLATPAQVILRLGEVAKIRLFSTPEPFDRIDATTEARDGSVVFTDRSVPIYSGGPAEFEIYGANVGQTEIVVAFPPESGHTTLVIPVEVKESTPRRRAAGR